MKRILAILLTIVIGNIFAQVSFSGVGPGAVAVNQRFYLKYTSNEKGTNLKMQPPSEFKILTGPNVSKYERSSNINGKVTSNTTYTYTYIVIATKEGKYTIPAASLTASGKVYKSNKIVIDVVKGSSNNSSNSNTNNNTNVSAGKNLFAKIIVDKKNAYVGEQITATVKIYTKYDIRGFQDAEYPSWNGFYKQDIPMPDQISLNKENVNGQIYYTAVLQKVILQAQKSGDLIISPAKFEVVALVKSNRRRGFFDSGYDQKVVKIKSNSVKISVKSLPPAPDGFKGAVGDFKLSSNIDKDKVSVNDAISLKVNISGSGNLKLIDNPELNFPPDFELFDEAKINDKISNSSNGSSGFREFEYIFAPRHSGTYLIPSFDFVYFNPKLKKYKTLQSSKFTIEVGKGNGDTTEIQHISAGMSKEDIKYLGKDIRHIKIGKLNLKKKGIYIFGSPFFIFVYLLLIIIFIIMFVIIRKRIKDNANIKLMKNKKASKLARKHLKNANNSLKTNNKNQFYEDITKAIFGYIGDKLNIPTFDLSKENIRETLASHSVENTLIDELISIIDTCEFERYAPSSKEGRLDEIYKSAETLINKLEKQIKKVNV